MPWHTEVDGYSESVAGKGKIGTTKKGIGPTYTDKMQRIGLKIEDLYSPEALSEKLDVILPIKNKQLKEVYNLPKFRCFRKNLQCSKLFTSCQMCCELKVKE